MGFWGCPTDNILTDRQVHIEKHSFLDPVENILSKPLCFKQNERLIFIVVGRGDRCLCRVVRTVQLHKTPKIPHRFCLIKTEEKKVERRWGDWKREKVVRLISEKRKQNKGRLQEKRDINNKVGKWSEATRVRSWNAPKHTQPDVLHNYSLHAYIENAERRPG